MTDTTPEAEKKMREMMMSRTGAERMMMVASMSDAARAIVIASLPKDLSPDDLKRRLVERIYGESLEHFLSDQSKTG
ncbi:MAG: hypothetical protein DMF72_15100 [Acidobacteria bacterium]|nr:MAG: hypothetical protein DMF72_15100 [Acidobacteriota bacterium]